MPRVAARIQALKIDSGRWTKTLDTAATSLLKNGAREFVRAMILQVPVWTGMARGSIKFADGPKGNLGRFLNVAIPIDPVEVRRGKGPAEGGALGHYGFSTARHVFQFYFRSDVPHFIHNEFFARSDAGAGGQQVVAPWRSLESGSLAFKTYVDANWSKLPKVKSYVTKTVIQFAR